MVLGAGGRGARVGTGAYDLVPFISSKHWGSSPGVACQSGKQVHLLVPFRNSTSGQPLLLRVIHDPGVLGDLLWSRAHGVFDLAIFCSDVPICWRSLPIHPAPTSACLRCTPRAWRPPRARALGPPMTATCKRLIACLLPSFPFSVPSLSAFRRFLYVTSSSSLIPGEPPSRSHTCAAFRHLATRHSIITSSPTGTARQQCPGCACDLHREDGRVWASSGTIGSN